MKRAPRRFWDFLRSLRWSIPLTPLHRPGKAGLKQGDLIVAMNGKPIVAFEQLVEVVRGSNGNPLSVTVRPQRQGSIL